MTRKNSAARRVRRAYSQDQLARVLTLPERAFGPAYGMQTVPVDRPPSAWNRDADAEDYYHFRDNGAGVLAVAHLDTVVPPKGRVPHFRATEKGPLVTSGALDDRLGAYVILHLLPALGITCDWLLTVGEESCASTAEFFTPGKDYDHVIEFDRTGTDVVMYQYEDEDSREAVEAAGARMGHGSFSDIALLGHLGVKAFNWGVGYRGNYHSEAGYAYLDDTFSMVAKYLRFSEQNAGTAMPHEPAPVTGYGKYDRYDDTGCYECFECGEYAVDAVTWYCRECGACADCGQPEGEGCMCYVPRHIREEAAQAGSEILSDTAAAREDADQAAG